MREGGWGSRIALTGGEDFRKCRHHFGFGLVLAFGFEVSRVQLFGEVLPHTHTRPKGEQGQSHERQGSLGTRLVRAPPPDRADHLRTSEAASRREAAAGSSYAGTCQRLMTPATIHASASDVWCLAEPVKGRAFF